MLQFLWLVGLGMVRSFGPNTENCSRTRGLKRRSQRIPRQTSFQRKSRCLSRGVKDQGSDYSKSSKSHHLYMLLYINGYEYRIYCLPGQRPMNPWCFVSLFMFFFIGFSAFLLSTAFGSRRAKHETKCNLKSRNKDLQNRKM